MLIIYTRPNNIFSKEYAKYFLSLITGKLRGPKAVLESMKRGLKEAGIPFRVNPPHSQIQASDLVHVVSGAQTLRECIELKEKGRMSKLIAGPSIAVLPSEEDGILLNTAIDTVLVPSPWVKNLYVSTNPELASKTYAWPAGVATPEMQGSEPKPTDYLIYVKNVDHMLLTAVESLLTKHHKSFKKIIYGEFEQKDFFARMNTSKAMIYLSPSESQGLALHEAWIRNVPTLAWSRGYWEYKGIVWKDSLISAPYLTQETGMTFSGADDFEEALQDFEQKLASGSFSPRAHSLEHFTDKKSAEALLDILGRHGV